MTNDLVVRERNKLQASVMESERRLSARKNLDECQAAAEFILRCYPNANVPDAPMYLRTLRELFLGYPAEAVEAIASPRTGIVTRCKFVPTIQEIAEMAEPIIARLHTSAQRDRAAIRQLEDRDEPPETTADERAEHVAEKLKGTFMEGNPVPAWLLDENDDLSAEDRERLEDYRRKEKFFARTQCAPGAAIAAHLKAEAEAE